MTRIRLLYYLLAIAVVACEETTEWDIKPTERFVVVDALITNELKAHEIEVYYSSGQLNQIPEPVSGAQLIVQSENDTQTFHEDVSNPGHYYSAPFRGTVGTGYRLIINFNEYVDTAYTKMTRVPLLKPFEIVPRGTLFKYEYHSTKLASMQEVFYDWGHDTTFSEAYGATRAMEVFYSLNSLDVIEELPPKKQTILFPKATTLIRKQYSLSETHEKYLRSLRIETELRGGIFDIEQGNIPNNFTGNTKGFFGACMVLSDTIKVKQ